MSGGPSRRISNDQIGTDIIIGAISQVAGHKKHPPELCWCSNFRTKSDALRYRITGKKLGGVEILAPAFPLHCRLSST